MEHGNMIGTLTRALIDSCCPAEKKERVIELLSGRASTSVPGVGSGSEWHGLIDRIQLASIRGSGWEIESIEKNVELANIDLRDLLVGAGFGDLEDHRNWQARALRTCDIE
jgi:hypothetical protein